MRNQQLGSFLLSVVLLTGLQCVTRAQSALERLREQAAQFSEQIVQVAGNVYTSLGTSVSNVTMIAGNGGLDGHRPRN